MSDFEKYTLLFSAASVAVAVWSVVILVVRSRRQIRAQLESQFFAEYTRRYQDIMMQLPQSIVLDRADLSALGDDAERERVAGLFRAYIDLCAEELFLFKTNRLATDVWSYWLDGIVDNFRIRALREVWNEVSTQRDYNQLKHFLCERSMQ